ncbi:MAG TPA: aldo/keto reductase [Chitinophagaceae bacterium]|nr:aldo/keto reductase [Chitinophagaceae bacterium]
MQYRKFGNTDLRVSEIGFGAWAIGGGAMIGNTSIGWGDADDADSLRAIHAALDAGINFFDTADIYGLGHSEELLGKTIGTENEIMIATKVGNVSRNNQFTVDYSKEYILKACEASLVRLKREVIDYYQLHTARMRHLQSGECIEAMQQLQQQGKIRYWGLSLNTFDPSPEAEFILNEKLGSGFQLVLNLLNQKALPLLKKVNEKGYGVIVRMPLQFGLLTGKFESTPRALTKEGREFSFPENDHRKNRLTKEVIDSCTKALAQVWELCKKYNCTKTQLALSYLLSYTEVSTVIAGIRTAGQVLLNTAGLFQLDNKDRKMIETSGKSEFVEIMKLIQQQG